MKHYSQRTNDATLRKCDEVSGNLIIVIHLEFLRNPLFNDEHFMAEGERLRDQRVCCANCGNLDHRFAP